MKKELERVSPASLGISARAVQAFLDYLASCGTEMHGLMILRHGKVAAEGWWQPYGPYMRHNAWSLTKSYVGTAVGLAADEGLVDLEAPITRYFPEHMPPHPHPKLKDRKVRHVLSMACGMEPGFARREMSGWIDSFFSEPILHEPGSTFFYNNGGSTLLGALVKKVTGEDFTSYLRRKIFDKIGIEEDEVSCMRLADGHLFGAAGMFTTTEANARLGQLYLQKGRWEGEQLISEKYIEMATSKQVDVVFPQADKPEPPEIRDRMKHAGAGYGFQLWMCQYPGSYRFDGAMGQYVVIVPGLDLLVSINESSTAAKDGPMCAVNAVFDYLVPGIIAEQGKPADNSPEEEALLAQRLASLAMPKLPGCRRRAASQAVDGKTWQLQGGGFALIPDIYTHLAGEPAKVESLSLHFTPLECDIHFTTDKGDVRFKAGMDGLARLSFFHMGLPTVGYAVSQAAWETADTLVVLTRYPETNFSMTLRLTFAGDALHLSRIDNLTFSGQPPEAVLAEGTARV